MQFLRVLASGRHFLKDQVRPNRPDVSRWGNTQFQADMMGIMGEYAVSKYLGLPFDTSINLEGDGGETDLMLGKYNIQVKSTKYKTGKLVFNKKEEVVADIFVLCYCLEDQSMATIQGYIGRNHVLQHAVQMDLGRGMRWVIEQRLLKPIDDLLKIDRQLT